MPQRNGQNPVRMGKTSISERDKRIRSASERALKASGTMQCPACKEEVPPKPGFRMRSMKCPKCGAAMLK